jgi:hypothetical protein
LQTLDIRKLCEVPGAVLAASTSPSGHRPTLHDEEPAKQTAQPPNQVAELRDVEPEEGFEPSTFRLRARSSASNWTVLVGSCLLALGAASIWSGPDEGSWVDWMIIGMIKAHSILRRMRTTVTARSVGRGMTLGARPRTTRRCHKERGMLVGWGAVGARPKPVTS